MSFYEPFFFERALSILKIRLEFLSVSHCRRSATSEGFLKRTNSTLSRPLIVSREAFPQSSSLHRVMAPPALQKQYMSSKPKKTPVEPRPSARYVSNQEIDRAYLSTQVSSILLISPTNQILLLHRVQSSSAFPSAHVFPGGNLSSQDGDIPPPSHPNRHEDGSAYRIGAIRECFEESGILLAKRNDGSGELLEIPEQEREQARKDIYSGKTTIQNFVESLGGHLDAGNIIFSPRISP